MIVGVCCQKLEREMIEKSNDFCRNQSIMWAMFLLARQMQIVLHGQVKVAEFFKLFFMKQLLDKYAIEAFFLIEIYTLSLSSTVTNWHDSKTPGLRGLIKSRELMKRIPLSLT